MVESLKLVKSWVKYNEATHFPIQNIPFGIGFSKKLNSVFGVTRIGDYIVNLSYLESNNLLNNENFTFNSSSQLFNRNSLNHFIEQGKTISNSIRQKLINLFDLKNEFNSNLILPSFHEISDIELRVPVQIGDYTDFYSSRNHAYNVGKILRPDNPLQPNWHHLPVGYHGI